jgi:hypothetical protein
VTHPEDVPRESAISVVGDGEDLGGLFDGFEAYRTPAEEDYRTLLTGGLVVLDTNVLLNLYRSTTRPGTISWPYCAAWASVSGFRGR